MSYEPRMRGSRFRRPAAKKTSAKEKREERGPSTFYQEPEQVNPSELSLKITNALEHLGNQRFGLPPFSEHFQRWLKDVKNLTEEFQIRLPQAADQQFHESMEKSLSSVRDTLTKRIEMENTSSTALADIHKQLTAAEQEVSKLDHEYKMRTGEVRRKYEKSVNRLRSDIDTLDRQRLKLLRKKTSFLQKIFGKADTELEEHQGALQTKKNTLEGKKESFKLELAKYRLDYETKRKQLAEQVETLRAKLTEIGGGSQDDALEDRRSTCEELRATVTQAVDRFAQNKTNKADTAQ
jgi:hypothetical protein